MQIETSRFGTLDVEDDKVINVVDGFLGFDDTKFILLTPTSAAPFCWLQSVETAELAFVAVDPTVFFPEYSVRITSDEHQKLGLSPEGEIVLVTLVTMAANPAEISTNLMGPVIINPETMKAKQIVLEGTKHSTKALLFSDAKPAASSEKRNEVVARVAAGVSSP